MTPQPHTTFTPSSLPLTPTLSPRCHHLPRSRPRPCPRPRPCTRPCTPTRSRTTCSTQDGDPPDAPDAPPPQRRPYTSLHSLRAALAAAVSAERYSEAALLRDELEAAQAALPDDAAVAAANEAFYAAVRAGDARQMGAVWMQSESVSCAHAMGGLVTGYEAVVQSWGRLFGMGRPTGVQVAEVSVNVRRNVAWLVCRQEVQAVRGRVTIGGVRIATNVFQKRRGKWCMVHHHASPVIAEDGDEM